MFKTIILMTMMSLILGCGKKETVERGKFPIISHEQAKLMARQQREKFKMVAEEIEKDNPEISKEMMKELDKPIPDYEHIFKLLHEKSGTEQPPIMEFTTDLEKLKEKEEILEELEKENEKPNPNFKRIIKLNKKLGIEFPISEEELKELESYKE